MLPNRTNKFDMDTIYTPQDVETLSENNLALQ